MLNEVTPGVLKIESDKKGPDEVEYKGNTYFRFMDYFYIQNKNLDELNYEQVSNLCRARAMYPALISSANEVVRNFLKSLVKAIQPSSLLEIGAGQNPVFKTGDDAIPSRYILSDADVEVIKYHTELNGECYNFSQDICELPNSENFLEMAIAAFVLHFPFHNSQLLEIKKRLKPSGVVVANVYRRSIASREELTRDIKDAGFEIAKIQDTNNLCHDHEYWIFGKESLPVQNCALKLKNIITQYSSQ